MGLKRELKEEYEKEIFREGERRIIEKYYTDPDESMHALMHQSFLGEYEPSNDEKRMMELELEIYRLKPESDND